MQEIQKLLNEYLKTNEKKYLIIYLSEINKRTDLPNRKQLLLERINNKTVLELMLDNNIVIEKTLNYIILNNDELLTIALSKEYTDMLNYANEETFFKKINDTTIFEYLLNNNLLKMEHLNKIENHKEIYDIIIEKQKEYYLVALSNNILHQKINNKYIFMELLEQGIIPFEYEIKELELVEELLNKKEYEHLQNISKEYINYKIPNSEKTIFEYLLNKNLVCYSAIEELNENPENAKEIYKTICKYNRYDLLLKLKEEVLLNKYDEKETILEKLLKNGLTPNIPRYAKKETIKILIENACYKELEKCTEEMLLSKLNSGKMIFELILAKKLSFKVINIESDLIAKKIFELKRYDLIKNLSVKRLLSLYNIQNTYLDIILKEIKNNKVISIKELNFILSKTNDKKQLAQIYLTYAKHNMINEIAQLSKKDLLEEKNGTSLIEILLDENKILTIEKIIPQSLLDDAEIGFMLNLHGIAQNRVKYEKDFTKDFVSEYLNQKNQEYENYPLTQEGKELLQELEFVMNDGKSDPELIDLLIKSYRFLLSKNSKYSLEINHLINIKKNNPNFSYIKTTGGSHFRPSTKQVALSSNNMDTLIHETTHVLFHFLTDKTIPQTFEKEINDLRLNPALLFFTNHYSKKYKKLKQDVSKKVEKILMREYDKNITQETRNEIEKFLESLKYDIKNKYVNHSFSEEVIDIFLDKTHTVDEYIAQNRKIKKEEMVDAIIRTEYGAFKAIGDFIDGIYKGKFHDEKLFIIPGKKISGAYGHGSSYYGQGIGFIFDEMLANYGTIVKSKNAQKNIETLAFYIGYEIINILDKYYDSKILLSQKYSYKSTIEK